jgi:hypothetical protein
MCVMSDLNPGSLAQDQAKGLFRDRRSSVSTDAPSRALFPPILAIAVIPDIRRAVPGCGSYRAAWRSFGTSGRVTGITVTR